MAARQDYDSGPASWDQARVYGSCRQVGKSAVGTHFAARLRCCWRTVLGVLPNRCGRGPQAAYRADRGGAGSNMASLDGARELKFFENQNAEMWDHSSLKEGESDIAQGVWSYDAATKRYALTLKGETTTYTLLSRGDPVTCILYKGHL